MKLLRKALAAVAAAMILLAPAQAQYSNRIANSTAPTHQWASGVSNGSILYSQPAAADISGLGTSATQSPPTCATALTWSAGAFGCNTSTGSGTVTSVGTGTGLYGGAITASGTIQLAEPIFGGRLSLTSGTPVQSANTTTATALYYVPYKSAYVTIYNGTNDQAYSIGSQLSLTLGSNWAANTVFDVFAYQSGGTAGLCTVAWTNATTRATALDIVTRGYYTNSGTPTCRTGNASTISLAANQGSYLGSFYTNGSTGTVTFSLGGTANFCSRGDLSVWNMYNRVPTTVSNNDNEAAYGLISSTPRLTNGGAACVNYFVTGLGVEQITAVHQTYIVTTANVGSYANVALGYDTTTGTNGNYGMCYTNANASQSCEVSALFTTVPAEGQHYVSSMESGDNTHSNSYGGTTTNVYNRLILQMTF